MNIARWLATIDELCVLPFPAEQGPAEVGTGGPGFFTAELERTHGLPDGDPAERALVVGQFAKYREGLYERLAERWGATDPWGLQTVLLRTEQEEIPEPWHSLSERAWLAYVWRVVGSGRWVGLTVADREETDEVRLLAVVTEIDPP